MMEALTTDGPSPVADDWGFLDDSQPELDVEKSFQTTRPFASQFDSANDDDAWQYDLLDDGHDFVDTSFTDDPIFNIPGVQESDDTNKEVANVADDFSSDASEYLSTSSEAQQEPISSVIEVQIAKSTLLVPQSCYEPFEPGMPIMPEDVAVDTLRRAVKSRGRQGGFVEFELNDFAVYYDDVRCPTEMRSLSDLETKQGHSKFYFNGVLSVDDTRAFVRGVPIAALPIDNYGSLTKHTVRDHIWIKSKRNADSNVYYKLGRPATEYTRFFRPFLWVADLAKHFVDFLKIMGANKRKVTIYNFRTTFRTWLVKTHRGAPEFVAWLAQHPSADFRTSIVANLPFLHKEAVGVLGHQETYSHTIWAEIWEFDRYKAQPSKSKVTNPPTIVTQYIYDCFEHLPFGDRLQPRPISKATQMLRDKLIQDRHLELPSPLHENFNTTSTASQQRIKSIKSGDTISTHRDEEGSGTTWMRQTSKNNNDVDRWFALVQNVHDNKKTGRREFDVLWYYRAVETLCGVMKYPWHNELFLSDHCSCKDKIKIGEDEVLGVHDVDFGGNSTTNAEFFCRQTYTHEERKWVTLRDEHRYCKHEQLSEDIPEHVPGDTLLIRLNLRSSFSEPCELVAFFDEKGVAIYQFRQLLRRKQVDPEAPYARPNELVYSDKFFEVRKRRIREPCHVRFFHYDEEIPTPYDRDGVGNCFFITHRQVIEDGVESYQPLEWVPRTLRQGPDPRLDIPKLRGMDLFCGGGNFGRGLEDGAGIEMNWANDYDDKAIHTYMANSEPEAVNPFLGSIDDLQRLAMDGQFSKNVPPIGDIDFVSGGSPCPGFSHLTNDKTTIQQRKNQSLVAAFGSFIDLYRPKYGLLENVTGIVQKKANKDQDVFSQLICAIVGLGYQTQFFFLDALQCGSSQRRSRVFLAFAAPGFALPRKPPQTHSHPPNTSNLGLGFLPNGLPMAEREMPDATPFKFVSAAEATAGLPVIGDAKPDICVPFPDHRISVGLTKSLRAMIRLIPTQPWGMNFAQAWFGLDRKQAGAGVLSAADRAIFPADNGSIRTRPHSNAFGRQHPKRPIETIVTRQIPGDAKQGRQLHWREPRVLTLMEARRAQGFRDEDVLLGKPAVQHRIVGNSVAREVAVALGVVFREAWVESLRTKGIGVAAGHAALPIVIEDDATSDSSLDVAIDDTHDARPAPSRSLTPSTAVSASPALTPASGTVAMNSSSQHAALPNRKRPLQSTLSVEIFSSKMRRTKK